MTRQQWMKIISLNIQRKLKQFQLFFVVRLNTFFSQLEAQLQVDEKLKSEFLTSKSQL